MFSVPAWSPPRFIPAGAGNTGRYDLGPQSGAVYPRWRGEHRYLIIRAGFPTGLSPLARGTHQMPAVRMPRSRFIPAGAGNTAASRRAIKIGAVYPRWRGEHKRRRVYKSIVTGLSPLARGTQRGVTCSGRQKRFIPAGAGNTWSLRSRMRNGSVYPRWRGEHPQKKYRHSIRPGLSPLARGTPAAIPLMHGYSRFIPAGAGNTGDSKKRGAEAPVYPRWRGEHSNAHPPPATARGLSPLARGTRGLGTTATSNQRFIPAGAGNTLSISALSCPFTVYPRWRGEHERGDCGDNGRVGLSPLARGTLQRCRFGAFILRFIPAGAGNTPR